MIDIQEQNVVTTSSNRSSRLVLSVLVTVTVIYMIVSLVLIVHTRKQLTQNQASQQASIQRLLQRQLETQTQLTASTEALARRLDLDEHEFQSQIEAKSGNFHRQQRELAKLLQSEVEQQQEQMGQFTGEVSNMRTELSSTNAKREHAIGDLNGQRHLIARTREELEELRHRGDRNYYEFTLHKGAAPTPVSTVSLQLKKVDPKRNKYTVNVIADDRTIEKKDRGVAEPLQFYTGRDRQLYEVVIFTTEKNGVTGYLSTPKSSNITVAGN